MSGGRAFLLTGGRYPAPARVGAGDFVLDAGNTAPLPREARTFAARDLLSFAEAEAIQAACLRFVTRWHEGERDLPPLPCSAGRAVESLALIELGQALKHLVLLRRFASACGAREIVADLDLPSLRAAGAALASGALPLRLLAPAGPGPSLRRAALELRRALAGGRSRQRGSGVASGALPREAGAVRVWGLANYRNRALLESLSDAAGISLRLFERLGENRYLRAEAARDRALADAAARSVADARTRIEHLAREVWPEIPGAHAVALDVLERSTRRLVPEACRETEGWRRLLAEDRPDVIVAGIPWAGDLRNLALLALREGILLAACQDGVLAEVGAGGVPVGGGALAWGPAGREWFVRRGFPAGSVLEVGDPYLERLLGEIEREDVAALRRRLSIPPSAKVVLASVQNSAPHFLPFDPADPVRVARILLEACASLRGFRLVLKPHPRLPVVDGGRRLALLRELVRGVERARIVEPDEPIRGLMALSDAHVGEGDTMSLEMLACGKPVFLLEREGLPPLYPDFSASGAMTVVTGGRALAERLAGGLAPPEPGARRALLERHLRRAAAPADAVLALAKSAPVPRQAGSR